MNAKAGRSIAPRGALKRTETDRIDRMLPELYAQLDLDELAAYAVMMFSNVVQCDLIAYSEVNIELKRSVNALDSARAQAEAILFEPQFEKHMAEHPLINRLLEDPDGGVIKISDFMSADAWHRTNLHREFFSRIDIEYQIAVPMMVAPPVLAAITLNRSRSDFTEHERAILQRLRPHVAQAYRNAARLTALTNSLIELEDSLISLGVGLIRVKDGHVSMTDYAEHCLHAFFPDEAPFRSLPRAVLDWVAASPPDPSGPRTLYFRQDESRLRFRMVVGRQDGEFLIATERQTPLSNADRLRTLGVSRREADILYWLAQGRSNGEIGITLNISPRTVSTHLETIFKKLDVGSRTTAAVIAIECLLTGG
ncbi:MAG: LuxR C-terminal-related transcriptional regulator [Burkholderiaceae bacterium]